MGINEHTVYSSILIAIKFQNYQLTTVKLILQSLSALNFVVEVEMQKMRKQICELVPENYTKTILLVLTLTLIVCTLIVGLGFGLGLRKGYGLKSTARAQPKPQNCQSKAKNQNKDSKKSLTTSKRVVYDDKPIVQPMFKPVVKD